MRNALLIRLLAMALCPIAMTGPATASTPSEVSVERAIVLVSPDAGESVAAYAVFANRGPMTSIAAAECDCAKSVELHLIDRQNPGRGMTNSWPLDLPAESRTEIAPPGVPRHMMLVGLRRPIQLGERIALKFRLADGQWMTANFEAVANSSEAWRGSQGAAE